MTYDEFLSAAVVLAMAHGYTPAGGGSAALDKALGALLGDEYVVLPWSARRRLRMAVRQSAGQDIVGEHLERGLEIYREITHGST